MSRKDITLKGLKMQATANAEEDDCPYIDKSWCELDEVVLTVSVSNTTNYVNIPYIFNRNTNWGSGYQDTSYSGTPSWDFGSGGGYRPPSGNQIFNELTNPCAKGIITELENGIYKEHPLKAELSIPKSFSEGDKFTLSEVILKLFNDSRKYDYIIQDGIPLNPISNADTKPIAIYNPVSKRYEITTTISTNYLNTATKLSIARTMIHESVHAYLVYEYRNNPQGDIYSSLNKLYNDNNSDINITHHEFFRQFVSGIAYSLQEWDKKYGKGGSLGWDYYYSMAWGGLTQYKIFKDIIKTEKERNKIIKIIENEKTNSSEAKGSNC